MLSVEDALEIVLNHIEVLEKEDKALLDCLGQVLADDVYADLSVPPCDISTMDGYAVQAQSTQGASQTTPRFFKVTGEVAAGAMPQQEVASYTAVRIMTGAPLPRGADCVVPFENTDEPQRKSFSASEIGVLQAALRGRNVRRAGEDIAPGALVLRQGTVLHPAQIGMLASLGRTRVLVTRRPEIAVLSTGDEIIEVGQPLPPGKMYNSNTYTIAAQVVRYGGIPLLQGIAGDRRECLQDKISLELKADLLITTGGVSQGDYDLVKEVVATRGEIIFDRVRMKPGKTSVFSLLRRKTPEGVEKKLPHLGFPGNPFSSLVGFEVFARPSILKMMGKKNLTKPVIVAIMEGRLLNRDRNRAFARVSVTCRGGQYFACPSNNQGIGISHCSGQVDGLAIVPEEVREVKEGDLVQIMMLDWEGTIAEDVSGAIRSGSC